MTTDLDKQIAADPRHPAQAAVAENIELNERLEEIRQLTADMYIEDRVGQLERSVVQLASVIATVIELVADNAEQPHTLATKMRELLEV